MKRIGLLGGIGPASTALYYELLMRTARQTLDVTPELVIYSLDFERYTCLEDTDPGGCAGLLVDGCRALERAGAEVLAMAANSAHAHFEAVVERVSRPMINIVETVCRRAATLEVRRPLLLGIPATLRSSVYPVIGRSHGLEVEMPARECEEILRHVVFVELSHGVVRDESREILLAALTGRAVDGLILGCTELSLLIDQRHADVPVLDSTRLHVDAILEAACDIQPTPRRPVHA